MTEHWKPVVGFEGLYEVSSLGRVRGCDRYIAHPRGSMRLWRGRILKQTVMTNGYLEVSLCKDGARTVRTVHTIVCEAFHGPAPDGYWAAHGNGKRTDCRVSNLSWKTPKDNQADKRRHGTHVCGSRHGAAKLTERQVRRIRRLGKTQTQETIARALGVTRRTVGRALTGQSWTHV